MALKFHISGIHQPPERVDTVPKGDVALSPALAHLNITGGEPAPSAESENTMADNQNIAATPYPFYATGGDDDSVQHAVLTSHVGAAVERNQDAGFSAQRDLNLAIKVAEGTKDGEIRALECRAALLEQIKDLDRRAAERDAEVKRELMAIRAEHAAADAARVSRELAKVEADMRQAKTDAAFAAILAKLTPPAP